MPASMGLGAANDLGLGDMLGQQVQDETEEERRKRLRGLQNGLSPQATTSPAVAQLFGLGGPGGRAY